jgi:ketosteroid isomerase-like protein
MEQASAAQPDKKALVQSSFERWQNCTGGPFELPASDAEWTIVGSAPLSKTYQSKQEFLDKVIGPSSARMAKPLVPIIRGLYADGDMVRIFF